MAASPLLFPMTTGSLSPPVALHSPPLLHPQPCDSRSILSFSLPFLLFHSPSCLPLISLAWPKFSVFFFFLSIIFFLVFSSPLLFSFGYFPFFFLSSPLIYFHLFSFILYKKCKYKPALFFPYYPFPFLPTSFLCLFPLISWHYNFFAALLLIWWRT